METNGIGKMINNAVKEIAEKDAQRSNLLLGLTGEIVSHMIAARLLSAGEVATSLATIHGALQALVNDRGDEAVAAKPTPAVNPKKSVQDDHIVCLEDGKKFKSLKRHIMTHYGLTPDAYRTKWGLDANYPMVAPAYAAQRSALAKMTGLGRKRGARIQ